MSYPNVAVSKNEFDYYYKTKNELFYLEKYLSLLYSNNSKRNSFSNGSSPQQSLAMISNNNANNNVNSNSFDCKYI